MASEAEQVFYKLAELAALLEVETSVLRFWEKEFREAVQPLKVGPRKKLYRPQDLEIFQEIKRLLQEERYTIAEARLRLARPDSPAPKKSAAKAGVELSSLQALLAETRRDLLAIRKFIVSGAGLASVSGRPKRTGKKP